MSEPPKRILESFVDLENVQKVYLTLHISALSSPQYLSKSTFLGTQKILIKWEKNDVDVRISVIKSYTTLLHWLN